MSTEQLENAFSNFDEALTGRIRSIGTDFTAAEEKNIEERVKELLEQLKQHARIKGTVVIPLPNGNNDKDITMGNPQFTT